MDSTNAQIPVRALEGVYADVIAMLAMRLAAAETAANTRENQADTPGAN